jgi:hypothetical protein
MTILNEQYLVQGAGTAGLVTRRAGAGGLSSNGRIVERRLTGTEEKRELYSAWILVWYFCAIVPGEKVSFWGIGWNICPPKIKFTLIHVT